ncbi:MAG: hypothetical protein QM488_18985 [Rhizobiaceae bacterium]
MSNIISLGRKKQIANLAAKRCQRTNQSMEALNLNAEQINISGGTITSAKITGALGTSSIPSQIGQFQYFVELVEANSKVTDIWSGPDFSEALLQAIKASTDFGVPVQSCVTGGAA